MTAIHGPQLRGIVDPVDTHGYVFDSSVAAWIPDPKTAAAGGAFSTQVAVSSVAGIVTIAGNSTVAPLAGSTWATRPLQSSAADLQMTATPAAGSTWATRPIQSSHGDLNLNAWAVDSTGNFIESSTKAAGTNSTMRGWAVRSCIPDCTNVSGQMSSAGDNVLASSAATGIYVYAYSLTPLTTGAQVIRFLSGSTVQCWRLNLQGGSTAGFACAISEMTVSPPAYLFRTGAGLSLGCNITSSGINYSVAFWRE